jgi:hypothetical protein
MLCQPDVRDIVLRSESWGILLLWTGVEHMFDYSTVMFTPVAPQTALVALSGVDTAGADTAACTHMLASARQLRGWLDAVEA